MKCWKRFTRIVLILSLTVGGMNSVIAETQSKQQLWTKKSGQTRLQAKLTSSDASNQTHNNEYIEAQFNTLNVDLMRTKLGLDEDGISHTWGAKTQAKEGNTGSRNQFKITVPLPDGTFIDLNLVNDSILPKTLAVKYPNIHNYRVLANDRVFSGKVDMNPAGFHAMLQMKDGEVIFIDPLQVENEYAIFDKSAQRPGSNRQHSCGVENHSELSMFNLSRKLSENQGLVQSSSLFAAAAARTQDSLINYTIAIATTGEYSAKYGGSVSGTLAAISKTINRVNQVLERDLGIHLNLAENNDLLINTDAASDYFTETKLIDLVFQNQEFIDSVIGNGNYDIGHLFTTSGGGLAAIASACNTGNKAKAASGTSSPRGDSFDLDFVAHEIGHQLGATHTFNSSQGACSGETRTARTAFEPGSGSSIMSYAGYCGLDNIQPSTDAMYHIGSIKQIENYTKSGIGSRCGVVKSSENKPPQVNAGRDYTIPSRTPFELSGTAVDSDGDALIYAWEQLDAGAASSESIDKGDNALFRVYAPNSSKHRSFPPLKDILNHTQTKGESLPISNRHLNMNFVAQDSFNVAQSDEMKVKVVRTGSRFALNYPRAHYTRGTTYPIYWNVANTDRTPINCTSVNVMLSLDGGKKFKYKLAENILNNGETLITIPPAAALSSQGRFKIKCSDNIFFAISHRNFFVTQTNNSISISYQNEDQPENNLKDVSLDGQAVVSSSVVTTDVTSNFNESGGGKFDLFGYLFFVLSLRCLFRLKSKSYKQFLLA